MWAVHVFFIVTYFMTLHNHQFINKMIESGNYNHTNVFRAVDISVYTTINKYI